MTLFDTIKQLSAYAALELYLNIDMATSDNFRLLGNLFLFNPLVKILRFQPEIINMCAETDCDFSFKTPYQFFMINNNYETKDFLIKCICVSDISDAANKTNFTFDDTESFYKYRYIAIGIDKNDMCPIWADGILDKKQIIAGNDCVVNEFDRCSKRIIISICNLMVDDTSKEIIPKIVTDDHNKKRIARGKKPIKSETLIRITGKTYETAKKFADDIKNQRNIHIVRGHWRHFCSEYYKHMKGEKEWIYPFVRGNKGEIIKKSFVQTEVQQ